MSNKHLVTPILTLVLMALPPLLAAQQRGGGRGPLRGQVNPIQALLEQADSLEIGLDTEQSVRLEAMSRELDLATSDARAAVAEIIDESGGPGPGMYQGVRPHLEIIQRENRAALDRARDEVLTEDQRRVVDAFLRSLRPRGRGGRRGGGPGSAGSGA